MFFNKPQKRIKKYLARNPKSKLIIVAGSYGRNSAINAIGNVLGYSLTVAVGIGYAEAPDLILLPFDPTMDYSEISPDFTVITSVQSDEEAKLFFNIANASQHVLINREDISSDYIKYLKNPNITTYGDDLPADYYYEEADFGFDGYRGRIITPSVEDLPAHIHLLGEHNLRPVIMASALARILKLSNDKIIQGLEAIRPLQGCMSLSPGLNGSKIIDDSADTSKLSMELSLRAVYSLPASSRILITGKVDPNLLINKDLISEVLLIDPKASAQDNAFLRIFNDELSLLKYLGTRLEPDGIVLLEYPLSTLISPASPSTK